MSRFSPFPLKNAKAATVTYTSIPSHKKKSASHSWEYSGLLQNLTGTYCTGHVCNVLWSVAAWSNIVGQSTEQVMHSSIWHHSCHKQPQRTCHQQLSKTLLQPRHHPAPVLRTCVSPVTALLHFTLHVMSHHHDCLVSIWTINVTVHGMTATL